MRCNTQRERYGGKEECEDVSEVENNGDEWSLPWFGKHTNIVSSIDEQTNAIAKKLEMP